MPKSNTPRATPGRALRDDHSSVGGKIMPGAKEPRFTFINLSHPDDLRDQNTMRHVRKSAMKHSGKTRKMRYPKRGSLQLVFELEVPDFVPSDAVALSRVGLETLDPFACCPFALDNYASGLCRSSKWLESGC